MTGGVFLENKEETYGTKQQEEKRLALKPWRAALYSFVFPGLGQMYNGEQGRGSYFFVIAFMLIIASHLIIPILALAGFWIYNVYQAYTYARKYMKDS
ncbi:MAG: hypothetical protein R2741_03870 [Methanolobus sp.]